jgi:hypothetical protein
VADSAGVLKLARLELHQARSNFYGQSAEFIDNFD